jgi:RNA recognition motif-containing protein
VADVERRRLPRDRETSVLNGHAHIELPSRRAAEEAADRLRGASFHGRTLRVDFAGTSLSLCPSL